MPKLNLGRYAKAIASVIGVALTYASLYYHGNHWVAAAIGIATMLGVYQVPNTPKPPAA